MAMEVIWRTFGVSYHPAHVSHLLRSVHLSVQQPIERATQRHEPAIAVWQTTTDPRSKKGCGRRADHPVGGPIELLSAADGRTHLGSTRADARAAGGAHA